MTTLNKVLEAVLALGQAAGKTPSEIRDEMVKILDDCISSLESDDGRWSALELDSQSRE